ncbi:MAG: thioredoxin family protein [Acidobacteria bacterium]|nr:thioredoxin family protein [Acidobacteriota bacterium]
MHGRHWSCPDRFCQLSLAAPVLMCVVLLLSAACGPKAPPATTPSPAPPTGAASARPPAQPVPSPPTAAQPGAAPAATPLATKPRPPAPPPLLGHLSRASLKAYESWKPLFAAAPYVPDETAVAAIKSGAQDVTVLLIMATWCPDSKRELPRYFTVMDAAGVSDSTLTMVGVDRTKKDSEGLTEKWGITRVPTFVFFRGGQELGRVVERVPAGSTLEAEIAKVLGPK